MPVDTIPHGMQLVQEEGKEIWDRLPTEPDPSWQYFQDFRDQGFTRTSRHVARRFGVNDSTIGNYRQRWHWDARAEAYDKHVEYEPQAELDSRALYARDLHGLASDLIKIARSVLREYKKRKLSQIGFKEGLDALKLSVELEKYARKTGDAQAEAEEKKLNEEIDELVTRLSRGDDTARRLRDMAPPSPTEVEAKTGGGIGVKRNARNRSTGLREIPEDAGEVCADGVEADMDS